MVIKTYGLLDSIVKGIRNFTLIHQTFLVIRKDSYFYLEENNQAWLF